jgi:hypothetical protein
MAYRNFIETCRSPATRRMYSKTLRYFMSYLRLPSESFDRLLDKDPKIIQMDICDYVIHLKKSGIIAPRSIQAYLAALHKFYVMNDVTQLNWTKIHSFLGDNEKQTEDQSLYTLRDSIANTKDNAEKPGDYFAHVFCRLESWCYSFFKNP